MITEDYIDFKLAKELKRLGIDKDIIWNHYYTEIGELKICSFDFKIPEDYYCSCPTLSIIQKWLREKKNINIMISNYDGRIAGHSEVSYMYIMNYIKPIKKISMKLYVVSILL